MKTLKNKSIQDGAALLLPGLALGAYGLIGFRNAPVQTKWFLSPYLFPLLLSVLAVLLAASLLGEGLGELRRGRTGEIPEKGAAPEVNKVLTVLLMSAAYDALLGLIGFLPATLIFLAALLYALGERRPRLIAAVSLLTPLLLYALFGLALGLNLP